LNEGQKARILDVSGEDAIAVRLMEMGLTDGEEIEHLGCAPLGDPIEFLIRGYRLSLRSTEAQRVIVEPIS
jgi:ferrous iron transport protein A